MLAPKAIKSISNKSAIEEEMKSQKEVRHDTDKV